MVDVQASLAALRGTAADFKSMSVKLQTASDQAAKLNLGKDQLSSLGETEGIIKAYKDIQTFMTNILKDGHDAMAATNSALSTAAKAYEQDELDGKHKVESVG